MTLYSAKIIDSYYKNSDIHRLKSTFSRHFSLLFVSVDTKILYGSITSMKSKKKRVVIILGS